MKIKILHTNDVHSRFENTAGIVTKIKELADQNTLLLDAGDFNDFMRLELQGTSGKAGVELLDLAGYDAIAVGNNELFQGLETLELMAQYGSVQFAACNLYKDDLSSINGINKSIILVKDGIRILVIGLAPRLHESFSMYNMRTVDHKMAVEEELKKNAGQYDICILLSHLGMQGDRDIAETLDGIDIIVGGHSHTLMNKPEMVRNTIIHQSGSYGEYLGLLEVEFEKGIKAFSGENIRIENAARDDAFLKCIAENKEKAIDNLSEPLYCLKRDMWHDVIEENPISNILADALKDVLKCEIGIINSGILNGGIRRGNITIKKLIDICPSPLNPTSMEIQGKYIRRALEKSMYSDFCTQDGKGPGFRGRFLGRLHVSGIVIEHDSRRIKSISIGGQELNDEQWYTAATSDYLQRGTGYTDLANNRNERYNPEYIRETLRDYLCREDYVDKAFIDRWVKK